MMPGETSLSSKGRSMLSKLATIALIASALLQSPGMGLASLAVLAGAFCI